MTIPFTFWLNVYHHQPVLCVFSFWGGALFLERLMESSIFPEFIHMWENFLFYTWMILFWGFYAWENDKFIFFLEFWRYFSNTVFLTQNIIVEMSKANHISYFCMWHILYVTSAWMLREFFFHTWGSVENKLLPIMLNWVFLKCSITFSFSSSSKNSHSFIKC